MADQFLLTFSRTITFIIINCFRKIEILSLTILVEEGKQMIRIVVGVCKVDKQFNKEIHKE